MDEYLQKLARSIGFLSRLPVPSRYFLGDNGALSETSGMFAVAGVVIVLPIAIIAATLHATGVDNMLIAAFTLSAQTLITCALHEDGLSDCADGFWGGQNKERILEIMHDSSLGAYGTLALIFSILLKFSALTALIGQINSLQLFVLLAVVFGLSRAIMVWHWRALPPAREDGVAKHVGIPSRNALRDNLITSAILLMLLILLGYSVLKLAFAIPITILSVYVFTRLVDDKISGHTGDTIGASQQISEAVLLLSMALLA